MGSTLRLKQEPVDRASAHGVCLFHTPLWKETRFKGAVTPYYHFDLAHTCVCVFSLVRLHTVERPIWHEKYDSVLASQAWDRGWLWLMTLYDWLFLRGWSMIKAMSEWGVIRGGRPRSCPLRFLLATRSTLWLQSMEAGSFGNSRTQFCSCLVPHPLSTQPLTPA